jgi:hypothetical protein
MPLPCNNVSVTPIKVSQLVRYSNLDGDDLLLTVQSGSSLWSRRSTINDLKSSLGRLTGSYSGSFTGSFKGISSGSFSGSYWGKVISKNTVASGSFSGSYWGRILSKNTKASGSFSGSHYGSLISKNTKATGSFSGSHYGSLLSKNTVASGSFSGSHYGSLLSKNTKATGSFRGSIVSTNTIASGSFSGSHYGSLLSKNTKASGSFSGSHYGSLISKNTKATGSFSGSHYGKVIGSNGSLITGSFRGIDNITNFRGTGKKVSFNGTASYAISSSYVSGPARLFHVYTRPSQTTGTPPTDITVSVTKPSSTTWYDFEIFLSSNARTNNGMSLEGKINFNTGIIAGTSVSEQYNAGTSSPNILPSTGIGNVLQIWEGTVDNDSCLCRWEHTGLVPSVISSTNTISFICGVNVIGGGYDGIGYQVSGLKASYYF